MIRNVQSVLRRPVTAAIRSAYGIPSTDERRLHGSAATKSEDRPEFKSERPMKSAKITDLQKHAGIGTLPIGLAGLNGNTWQSNLDFSSLPSDLIDDFRRAGMRGGSRDLAGAEAVWETIPHTIRMAGPEAVITLLEDKEWSHIVAHSRGGSDSASNGIFEDVSINRARGAETMTSEELGVAQQALQMEELRQAVELTAAVMIPAALVTSVVESVFAAMEDGLRYYDGEMSKAELQSRVLRRLLKRAAVGAVIAGLVVGLAIAIPPFIPVLSILAWPLTLVCILVYGYRSLTLGAEWMERVGPEPVATALRQAIEVSDSSRQAAKGIVARTWQGAGGLSNRAIQWVG